MSLIDKINQKIFGGSRLVECEAKYVRKDLYVFATTDFDIREDNDYCFVGYYNNDKTKIKDVLTGKVYDTGRDCARSEDKSVRFEKVVQLIGKINDDKELFHYLQPQNYGHEMVLKDVKIGGRKYVMGGFVSNGGWEPYPFVGCRSAYKFFINTEADEVVGEKFIRNLVNELNKLAHQKVLEFNTNKQKVDNVQKGYNKNF